MNIPKLGVEKSKVSQVGNIVYDAGMNVGEAIGLVKREPWYIYWLKVLGIILVLSFLGLNIFTYLKEGVDAITYFVKKVSDPIVKPITTITRPVTKPIIKGLKKTVDLTTNTAKDLTTGGDNALDIEEEQEEEVEEVEEEPEEPPKKPPKIEGKKGKIESDDRVEEAWKREKKRIKKEEEPEPDSAYLSEIQDKKKVGWCLIGTNRGFRSCVKVGAMDRCMSGKVYQTEAVCHDPRLRP